MQLVTESTSLRNAVEMWRCGDVYREREKWNIMAESRDLGTMRDKTGI
jgi:hypothetical protein